MKERPIIFSTEMVRAILRGDKTQTRRVIKPQPAFVREQFNSFSKFIVDWNGTLFKTIEDFAALKCPYGVRGDQLWVRERFAVNLCGYERGSLPNERPMDVNGPAEIIYRADGELHEQFEIVEKENSLPLPWRAGRFMPRWASRLTLEIVNVRAEHVQNISEKDAIAEGIKGHADNLGSRHSNPTIIYSAFPDRDGGFLRAREAFEVLWDSINKKSGYGWDANPYVWAVEFKKTSPRGENVGRERVR